ncbi:MAG: E3 binding domain-containing protein, partial [Proteobacteria bacterium]|nr:E3 binding domain-containing protein [Pseudomonadota bacterium]
MTIEIKVPTLGESVSEAAIAKLYKKAGDPVKADELLVELETDKVTLEVNAPSNGVIAEIKVNEGDNVNVGDLIATMKEGTGAEVVTLVTPPKAPATKVDSQAVTTGSRTAHPLSPAPKKIAAENNIDTANIAGTGKDGRVTKGDVLNAVANGGAAAQPAAPSADFGDKPVER